MPRIAGKGIGRLVILKGTPSLETLRQVPRDAMVVKVIARQWAWAFVYPNGKQTNELYLALDRPVKIELESSDVVHGFFIPAFRVKQDAVPGKRNYTWFAPTALGSYDIQCTVICGVSHTYMLSKARVLPEADFKDWSFGDAAELPKVAEGGAGQGALRVGDPARGEVLARSKGCLACHTTDGAKSISDSRDTRRSALMGKIPYVPTIPGAVAAVEGIIGYRNGQITVRPQQDYFAA